MKLKMILTLFFFASFIGFSQIKGLCVDENGNAIPYVNISIKGKTLGTVSNDSGNFSLENATLEAKDSIIFSHINFRTTTIGISDVPSIIKMIIKTEDLDEVLISSKRKKIASKEKTVGTKSESGNVILKFVSRNLGTEVGKIIEVKENQAYDLKKVSFNIVNLGYKSATFRVNFYHIEDGIIQTDKVNYTENIVKVNNTGLVEIDLTNQMLSFNKDFVTSIEWIDFENDDSINTENRVITISSTVFSGPFLNRYNVNLSWITDKVKYNVGVGIHLLVDVYKN